MEMCTRPHFQFLSLCSKVTEKLENVNITFAMYSNVSDLDSKTITFSFMMACVCSIFVCGAKFCNKISPERNLRQISYLFVGVPHSAQEVWSFDGIQRLFQVDRGQIVNLSCDCDILGKEDWKDIIFSM